MNNPAPTLQQLLHPALVTSLNSALTELDHRSFILDHFHESLLNHSADERFVNITMLCLENVSLQYKSCRWWLSVLNKQTQLLKQYDVHKARAYGAYAMAFHQALDKAFGYLELFRALSRLAGLFRRSGRRTFDNRTFWEWYLQVDYEREIVPEFRRVAYEADPVARAWRQEKREKKARETDWSSWWWKFQYDYMRRPWLKVKYRVLLCFGKMKTG